MRNRLQREVHVLESFAPAVVLALEENRTRSTENGEGQRPVGAIFSCFGWTTVQVSLSNFERKKQLARDGDAWRID